MRNSRTSKYNKKVSYFVQSNGMWWDVVEFPSNDIVRTFKTKEEAELLSEQINHVKPFGEDKLPPFMKGNDRSVDISE
ncbi:MAG TPA: hypothetical protein DCX27_00980 [Balneola sp.]|nr:hypothetical protein [Balneola sp.]